MRRLLLDYYLIATLYWLQETMRESEMEKSREKAEAASREKV